MESPDEIFNSKGRSPFRWIGGKYHLSRKIIPLIPEHTCYCEPFAGAAWVFFRKAESKVEVINDINRNLVTFYRVIQNHLEEFIRYFKWALVSRDEFERLKLINPETQTDIQRAARFYYMQQMCFGGRGHNPTMGYSSTRGPSFNLLRIEEQLSAVHLRLARVYIECLPYSQVLARYDRETTFFYVDPPYWDCEEYYGKGIFAREDFDRLAEQLAGIKGKFLLSLNDRPEVRNVFEGFMIEEVDVPYSCSKGRNFRARELLIRNY